MKRGFFQKNAVLATIIFGCNILIFIFFLITIILFNILYLKIVSIIILLLYTALDVFLLAHNLVRIDCTGINFNLSFRKCSVKWSEITNIEIRGDGSGRNPAYKVIILYLGQELKFITTSWGVKLFIEFCPKDKLCHFEL